MIAFYRRIPKYISNKIRTLATSQFLDFNKKNLTIDGDVVGEFWDSITRTSKHKYRMLDIKKNIRMLFISDSRAGNDTFCSIRVGVGANDDTRNLGMSHLLEHVISNMATQPLFYVEGETCAGITVYSFRGSNEHFWKRLKLLSENMFFTAINDETQVMMQQMFKWNGITMPEFSGGSFETFGGDVQNLINELEERHKLYRERPVFACIYSPLPLQEIQDLFVNNFWILRNYSQLEQKRRPRKLNSVPRNPPENKSCKNLFVVKSDADLIQLNVLFPVNRQLTLLESNTFEFISYLLDDEFDGSLANYLLDRKMGTSCYADIVVSCNLSGFFVNVDLSKFEKDNVRKVISAIYEYIKFVHSKWEKLNQLKEYFVRKSLRDFDNCLIDHVEYIVKNCDASKEEFDDIDAFSMMETGAGRRLIAKEILQNENVVYSIVARQPKMVIQALGLDANQQMETEPIYQTQFHSFRVDLFEHKQPEYTEQDFEIVLNTKRPNRRIAAFITDTKDMAHQTLCLAYLRNQSRRIRNSFDVFFPGDCEFHENTYGRSFGTLMEALDSNIKESFGSLVMDDEQFKFARGSVMRNLSIKLTDSTELAKSLLITAILNIQNEDKMDPIPKQYETLRVMTRNDIHEYLKSLRRATKLDKRNAVKLDGKDVCVTDEEAMLDAEFLIESINENELVTETLHFFKVNEAHEDFVEELIVIIYGVALFVERELGIYTLACYSQNIGRARGIVIETRSVEHVAEQSSGKIRQRIRTMIEDICEQFQLEQHHLTEMLECMKEWRVCIQIIGHKECKMSPERTFEKQFLNWYGSYEPRFANFFFLKINR